MIILFLANMFIALRHFILRTVPKEVSMLMEFSTPEWDVFIVNAVEPDLILEY